MLRVLAAASTMTTVYVIESRRGQHTELRLTDEAAGPVPYAVGLFPIGSDCGICIGVGATALGALGDALDTLQMGRWSLHDAITLHGKQGGAAPAAGGGAGGNRGGDGFGGVGDA